MALRWRENGNLVCAATHPARHGDTYIDDRLHQHLAVKLRCVVPDPDEKTTGVWHWSKALGLERATKGEG